MADDKKTNTATEGEGVINNANAFFWVIGLLVLLFLANITIKHTKAQQKVQMSAKATQAQIQSQTQASSPTEPMVISLTAGVWSDWVELPTVIPGAKVFYLGPKGTQIEYSDGSKFYLDDPTDVGIKFPRFKFLSPTGGEIRVIQKG